MIIPALLITVVLIWIFSKGEPEYKGDLWEDSRRLVEEGRKREEAARKAEMDALPKLYIGKFDGNIVVFNEQELAEAKQEARAAGGRLIDQYLELYHQGRITKEECENGMDEVLDSYPKNH
jgi:hypothetical protein